jgi:hypothetical protein
MHVFTVDAKIKSAQGRMRTTASVFRNSPVLPTSQYSECHCGNAYIYVNCTQKICLKQILKATASKRAMFSEALCSSPMFIC